MKTAEEILRDYGADPDAIDAVRAYGAQVREEAARIAQEYNAENILMLRRYSGDEIAAAIRKMELP